MPNRRTSAGMGPPGVEVPSVDLQRWLTFTAWSLLFAFGAACTGVARELPRYVAMMSDGRRIEGNRLSDWSAPGALPRLDGQPLLDPRDPFLWLCDRHSQPAGSPAAYIETYGGDCLPGEVFGYRSGASQLLDRRFDCYLVRPQIDLSPPSPVEDPRVRVEARFVRRIVWQSQGMPWQPSTVLYRDGHCEPFRSVRPGDGYFFLLTDQGAARVDWSEIAEIHFPPIDLWQSYLDELATLCPDCETRLIQVQSSSGLRATASLSRHTAYASGSQRDSDLWVHGIQPAWSQDVLWLPFHAITTYLSFSQNQCPLSRLSMAEAESPFPIARRAERDRSISRGWINGAGRRFGWGWGVHAPSRLEFRLPPVASSFLGSFGLDRSVGDGGCVQARVFIGDATTKAAYESPLLVGSETVVPIGPLACPPRAGPRSRLVLEVDPAHENRPAGADPFDIRDLANWLDPLFELASPEWARMISAKRPAQLAAWQGWQLDFLSPPLWRHQLRRCPPVEDRFLSYVMNDDSPLILRRKVSLPPDTRWLAITACRDQNTAEPPAIRVFVDRHLLAEQPIPYREKWQADVTPMIFSLKAFAGRDVELRIEQRSARGDIPVNWQGIVILSELPMVRRLLEDRFDFVRADGGSPAAELREATDAYSGKIAVQIPAKGRFRIAFDTPLEVRERPAWGQYRFLRFAFRAPEAQQISIQLDSPGPAARRIRYVAGEYSAEKGARQVRAGDLPPEWIMITRDVYADFGELDIRSVTVSATGGQSALFDHIYLARSIDDFQRIPMLDE